ncbi:MAG: HlyD family efflux transporter periplasmic adaptor subunit [Pirellulaceae bacterium]|nr:HlyD family efflux transporter periplasmic adaptor subunit [Pirellulaceae bacterium]
MQTPFLPTASFSARVLPTSVACDELGGAPPLANFVPSTGAIPEEVHCPQQAHPRTQAAAQFHESSAEAHSVPQRLLDFNRFPPNGSQPALAAVLAHIEYITGAELIAGFLENNRLAIHSTRSDESAEGAFSNNLVAAVREAAATLQGFGFAIESEQSSIVLQCLRQELATQSVISFGVSSKSLKLGLVLSFDRTVHSQAAEFTQLLNSLRLELSAWIGLWHLCQTGQTAEQWLGRAKRIYAARKYWLSLLCIAVLCLAIPVPFSPRRDCIVEPAFRRFLTSPVAGRVMSATVRPGDIVQTGMLLAQIDDEPLRWELSRAEADLQQAIKKRDTAMAARNGGEVRLADLEQQRISLQIEDLQSRLAQLEIRSPIDGVVVAGDWVPTSGATVQQTDTLFEIAPLEHMRIQILLSTEDLGQIDVHTPVLLRVDSAHGQSWTGKVRRIDPRGHVEANRVVFFAETEVENQDQALRPGMRGTVRLSAGWKSLGWLAFHRPYIWFMKKFAW